MAHQKSTDPDVFILPDLGEGVHEAELIKWRVQVGQAVAEHDILAEMETDKALVEVPSPRAGVIRELHGSEGEILHVGNPLVSYQPQGGATTAPTPQPSPAPASNGTHEASESPPEDAGTVVGAVGGALGGVSASPGKALATPAVRRLARELGVNIDSVAGTGIAGRVLEADVRSAASGGRPASTAPAKAAPPKADLPRSAPSRPPESAKPAAASKAAQPKATEGAEEGATRIPFRGVRRTIANRLRESVDRAVHFNVMDEADVSALDGLRRKLAAASGEKVSFLPFVASAVARVLTAAEFRSLNSTVDEDPANPSYEASIIQHRALHLGIATDTDSGLMVPVVRDADGLGVLEISRQIASIAAAARSRSIPREQLMGSTFTISNVGSHAGRFATPIINYPEVGILAVGRGRQAPVIRSTSAGPAFGIGLLLPLSLACDHRVVDGATAALALARIIELLQDPEQLLGPARG